MSGTFVPNNDLERDLMKAAVDPAARPDFIRMLIGAPVQRPRSKVQFLLLRERHGSKRKPEMPMRVWGINRLVCKVTR